MTWDELAAVHPEDFDIASMPPRFAGLGDLHAELDAATHAGSLEPVLEQAAKDERDAGLGDLPYPPEYPKMPGEPLRVQPSRARHLTSDNTAD